MNYSIPTFNYSGSVTIDSVPAMNYSVCTVKYSVSANNDSVPSINYSGFNYSVNIDDFNNHYTLFSVMNHIVNYSITLMNYSAPTN